MRVTKALVLAVPLIFLRDILLGALLRKGAAQPGELPNKLQRNKDDLKRLLAQQEPPEFGGPEAFTLDFTDISEKTLKQAELFIENEIVAVFDDIASLRLAARLLPPFDQRDVGRSREARRKLAAKQTCRTRSKVFLLSSRMSSDMPGAHGISEWFKGQSQRRKFSGGLEIE